MKTFEDIVKEQNKKTKELNMERYKGNLKIESEEEVVPDLGPAICEEITEYVNNLIEVCFYPDVDEYFPELKNINDVILLAELTITRLREERDQWKRIAMNLSEQ